jgi:hypothetical protein
VNWLTSFYWRIKYRNTGWEFQPTDDRDYKYDESFPVTGVGNDEIINNFDISIRDQGWSNACTGFATAYMLETITPRIYDHSLVMSPLYCWNKARVREDTIKRNVGVNLRTTIKTVFSDGCVQEKHYPFLPGKYYEAPPSRVDTLASIFLSFITQKHFKYYLMHSRDIDHSLLNGYSVVLGVFINDSWHNKKTRGVISGDSPHKSSHAILITDKVLIGGVPHYKFANSWGRGWGEQGFGHVPVSYIEDYAHNIWSLRMKED